MIAQVRVRRGDFGKIRRIYVEYPQGFIFSFCLTKQKKNTTNIFDN
jgi:hypothetical protein